MIHTFKIDASSQNAKASLEYLRTLDFIEESNATYVMSDEQLSIVEERRESHLSGKSTSHTVNDVFDSLAN